MPLTVRTETFVSLADLRADVDDELRVYVDTENGVQYVFKPCWTYYPVPALELDPEHYPANVVAALRSVRPNTAAYVNKFGPLRDRSIIFGCPIMLQHVHDAGCGLTTAAVIRVVIDGVEYTEP